MLINVEGCTEDQALEALGLLDNVEAEIVRPVTPVVPEAFYSLPNKGTKRQAYLLHFIREGRSNRERARRALGSGSTYGGEEARIAELLQGGWLAETSETEKTSSGRDTGVLVPTEKAKRAVKLKSRDWFPLGVRIDPS